MGLKLSEKCMAMTNKEALVPFGSVVRSVIFRGLQFPHFSHRIHARLLFGLEMTLLWGGFAALIAVNVFFIQKSRPAHWDKLVMLLWNRGYKQEARSVLGATTDLLQTLARQEDEAAGLEKKYAFWQTVASSRPDYRDAFITLAALAYQLGKTEEARSWLTRAFTLDPNSPVIQKFSTLIK